MMTPTVCFFVFLFMLVLRKGGESQRLSQIRVSRINTGFSPALRGAIVAQQFQRRRRGIAWVHCDQSSRRASKMVDLPFLLINAAKPDCRREPAVPMSRCAVTFVLVV